MSETQQYRSRMRKNALRLILGIYLVVITPFTYKLVRTNSLAADAKTIQARVTSSRPPGGRSQDDHGQSSYIFSVGGNVYSGSAALEVPVGSMLNVYYSQSAPANNSFQEPTQAKSQHQLSLAVITFGYGFMALLALILMSVISPAKARATAPARVDDIGIARD